MSLTGKLVDLIYKIAVSDWKKKVVLAPLVGLLFLSLLSGFIFVSLFIDRILEFPKILVNKLNFIIGAPVLILGFVVMTASVYQFIKMKGTPVPLSPPPKLVRTGLYKYSRNPMLSGIFMLFFGLGIILNSISLVFIFTPVFILIMTWELKNIEEPELEKRLGKEYLEYKKEVPMFFPRLKK
jgi:protein-S-isoprenylcysteine O-methyltransferase Ste14